MKIRSFLALGLLTVLLMVSCAPAPVGVPAPAEPEALPQPAEPVSEDPPTPPPAEIEPADAPADVPPTEAAASEPEPEPEPEFVSRGPDLEATDPATVNLASGELQLVEFFRFT